MTVPLTGWFTGILLVVVLLEPIFILAVAPRLTRRMVKRDATTIFEDHMRPGIRQEVAAFAESSQRAVALMAQDTAKLLATIQVPPPEAVAAAVRDALVAAQAKAMEGKPDPIESFRAVIRSELEAAMNQLAQEDAQLSVEDAAQVMSRKGVDARMTFAAQEEQFTAAVLKAAGSNGPLAVAALEQAKGAFPATYKVMVRRGPAAVPAFFKQAGIKAVVGGHDDGGHGLL